MQSTSMTVSSDDYGIEAKPTAVYRGLSVHVTKVENKHELKLTRQELIELVKVS